MNKKEIYHVKATYSRGHSCERWCFDADSRDRYISEVKADGCKSCPIEKVRIDTYVLQGKKTEYYK